MRSCDYHYGAGRELRFYRAPLYTQSGAGFFGDLFRHIIPLIKDKVVPYVGKRLYQTGKDVMDDIEKGTGFKRAIKRGVKRTVDRTKEDLFKSLSGKGYKRRKRTKDAFQNAFDASQF